MRQGRSGNLKFKAATVGSRKMQISPRIVVMQPQLRAPIWLCSVKCSESPFETVRHCCPNA